MSLRHVVKTVAVACGATAGAAVFMLGLGSGVAGASSLVSSDGNTTISTTGTPTPGTPYDSGQKLSVSVIANGTMSFSNLFALSFPGCTSATSCAGNFNVEECVDPGGLPANLPTTPAGCEAATDNILAALSSSGALTLSGTKAFKMWDLPNSALGPPTMTGVCDQDPNQCVLGIFAANPQSSNGFSYPHLFSAPFQVSAGDGSNSGDNPGDGTPEVPLAIGLPLAALAVVGGVTLRHRKRQQQAA
jgi:hypothetical protein